MAIGFNPNINTTQRIFGDYNIYNGKPNYYGQYTDPGYTYDVDNCFFINNNSGTQDQIQFDNLPLLTATGSSYRFNIRGGNGNGMNNIINTVNVPYLNYNTLGDPLKINVSDNNFSNCWVEIYRNDPGNNRVLIGTKHFDVKFSTSGNRESYVNGDLINYDPASSSLLFKANSIPSNSRLLVYDNSGINPINPTTGNEDGSFTGIDTDSIGYPYSYRINSSTSFYRDLSIVVVNKSNSSDTVTYGGNGDYAPLSIISNNGNYINFQGVSIINDLEQPARLLIRDSYCSDDKYITISSANNSVLAQGYKTAGSDLVIPLGSDQNSFFTAADVYVTISDDSSRTTNAAAKMYDLNSSIGAINNTAAFNFYQYYGATDHLDITNTPINQNYWLMTTDPSTGSKFNPIFGDTSINFFNDYEPYGMGYNLAADILGNNNGISAGLYDSFLRPVISNSWIFDNTPPAIITDLSLITENGIDIYIGRVDNPNIVAQFDCAVSDNIAIGAAYVELSYDQTTWNSIPMTSAGGNNYTRSLYALDYPWLTGNIYYRLRTVDTNGNTTISPTNQMVDVSISKYSSFMIDQTQDDEGFIPGMETLHINSIIGDGNAQELSLKVYNTSSECVADIPVTSSSSVEGFRHFYWDGRNSNGDYVDFGTYKIKIHVKGYISFADLDTELTFKVVKEKNSQKDEPCILESALAENDDLNYYRKIRNICINGKLDPATEQNKVFAALETGVVFYYKTATPFYKKHLKNDYTDYFIRKTVGGVAEFARTIHFESFLAEILDKENALQQKIAGR